MMWSKWSEISEMKLVQWIQWSEHVERNCSEYYNYVRDCPFFIMEQPAIVYAPKALLFVTLNSMDWKPMNKVLTVQTVLKLSILRAWKKRGPISEKSHMSKIEL